MNMKPIFKNCNVCGRGLVRDDELSCGMCAICANEEIPIMNQPIIKPSRWQSEPAIENWTRDGWTIRRHNRTSGKAGYHAVASADSENNARQLASAGNDGMSMWKYSIIAPDGTVWTDIGESDKPLSIDVRSGVFRISIGAKTLAFSAENDDGCPNKKITGIGMLAEDVRREMMNEREDGSTILTDVFDKAINAAYDNGSTAFDHSQKQSPVL